MFQLKGSITVFLCFILVFVLALVGTLIDVARLNVSSFYANQGLVTALDSTFTNYHKELYEDYKLFLLENNPDITCTNDTQIVNDIQDSLAYSGTPCKENSLLDNLYSQNDIDLFQSICTDCSIVDKTYATDYEGGLVLNEIINYMKYKCSGELITRILGQLNLVNESAKTTEVTSKQLEVEESVGELDEKLIELIEEIEGIQFADGELQMDRSNRIKVSDCFAKKYCTEEVNAQNVGIDKELVWKSMKNMYINPLDKVAKMKQIIENGLQKNGTYKLSNINFHKLESIQKELVKETNNVLKHMNHALGIIDEIKVIQTNCNQSIKEFSNYLENSKEELSSDIYNTVHNECESLKEYVDMRGNEKKQSSIVVSDIAAIKSNLEVNREILQNIINFSSLKQGAVSDDIQSWYEDLKNIENRFCEYSISRLRFNYSTLKVNENTPNPLDTFKSLMSDGILALIVDDMDNLSSKELLDTVIRETFNQTDVSKEKDNSSLSDNIMNQRVGEDGVCSNLNDYSTDYKESNFISSAADKLAEKYLLSEYVNTFFRNYTNFNQKTNSFTYMNYEQEYIAFGNTKDIDNIKSFIFRTALLRTVFNYTYLLTDSPSREKAQLTATALVGFTGFAPLITVTKHLILMMWSYVESLVDVRALLDGKEIPFIKTSNTFQVQYSELFQVSKKFIKKEAQKVNSDAKIGSFSYMDYLRMYTILNDNSTITYRIMDLIQANMRGRYTDTFSFSNCLFGMRVKCSYEVPELFLSLPYVRDTVGYEGGNAEFSIEKEYSY